MLMEDIEVEVYRSTIKIPAIFFVPMAALLTAYTLIYFTLNSNYFVDQVERQTDSIFPGKVRIGDLVTDPTFTSIQVVDPYLEGADGKAVIEGGVVQIGLNPLPLLVNRIQVSSVDARDVFVHLVIEEEGTNLTNALRLEDSGEASSSAFTPGISLYNLNVEDCKFVFDMEDMHFEIAQVNIPHAEIDIEDGSAAITVDQVFVDRAPFRFQAGLFSLGPEWGEWTPVAENVQIDNWSWVNDGFSVERVHIEVDGTVLDASGVMNFPSDVPDSKSMTYRASGKLTAPFWTDVPQYFVREFARFDIRNLEIETEGDLGDVFVSASYEMPRLNAYGVRLDDVTGTFTVENQNVFIGESTAGVHGGQIELEHAYFDMYTGVVGGAASFKDVNPKPVAQDIGFEFPWLDGRSTGAISFAGFIPYEREIEETDLPYLGGFEDAVRPIVEVTFTEESRFVRRPTDVLPGQSFRAEKGARVWSQQDRVGVPYARTHSELSTFVVRDFILNYNSYLMEDTLDGRSFVAEMSAADIGPLVAYYGGGEAEGSLSATFTGTGRMNYPNSKFDVEITNPKFEAGPIIWSGDKIVANGTVKNGVADLQPLLFSGDQGSGKITGTIGVLRNPDGLFDHRDQLITDFLYSTTFPWRLDIDVRDVPLSGTFDALGTDVPIEGRGNAKGALAGSAVAPEGNIDISTSSAAVFGQPLESATATLNFDRNAVGVADAQVDLGRAGRLRAQGKLKGDDIDFELSGRAVRLSEIVPLQNQAALSGVGSFDLHGKGDLSAPKVGGFIRVDELGLDGRKIGDVALVANTSKEIVHLSGALLPWVTIDAEIPYAQDQSYYAKLGIDHVDLTRAIDELRSLKFVSSSSATGTVEVFVEKDFSRYQVLANLSDLELQTLGKRFKNRGPIIAGLNEERLLQIQQAEIGTGGRYVATRGGVFLDQSLIDLSIDGALDLSLLNGMRAAFPGFFPESFLEADGLAVVDASFRGTPDAIAASGKVAFEPTEILLRDFADPLVIISGEIVLDDDRVFVPTNSPIRGRILSGLFSATGQMAMDGARPKNVIADIWTQNLSYRIPDVADFTFGTQLSVSLPDIDRADTWQVTGDVRILDGLYYENFSILQAQLTDRLLGTFTQKTEQYEASIIERYPELEEISWDVNIAARDGFRIKNEIDRLGLDLELRVGLRLQNTLIAPNVTGNVAIVGGSVTFQGERFDVRNGALSFSGDAANPFVDVVADSEIQNACRNPEFQNESSQTLTLSGIADSGEQQTYNVTLNVRGRFENLDIQFESTPFADQRDILSLLLTGCTVDQLTASSASSPTLEVALGPVLGWIEGQVQDAVKVEEFTITPSVDRLKATVGDSITRRLSWRFQLDTGLTETAGGQVGQLVYKLSDQWSAQLSESISNSSLSEEQDFLIEFKLKYRLLLD